MSDLIKTLQTNPLNLSYKTQFDTIIKVYNNNIFSDNIKYHIMLYEIYRTIDPVTIHFKDGTQIIACKPILVAISDYFKSVFDSLQEPTIILDTNSTITQLIIESCYMPSIQEHLTVNNIIDILVIMDHLLISLHMDDILTYMRKNIKNIIDHHQLNGKLDQCIFISTILDNNIDKKYQDDINIIVDYLMNANKPDNIFVFPRWNILPDKTVLEQIGKNKAYHQFDKSRLTPSLIIQYLLNNEYDTESYCSLTEYQLYNDNKYVRFNDNKIAVINSYYPILNYTKYKKFTILNIKEGTQMTMEPSSTTSSIHVGDIFYLPNTSKHVTITSIDKVIHNNIISVTKTTYISIRVQWYYILHFDVPINHYDCNSRWYLKTTYSHTIKL